jgi:transmembrane sensor
MLTNDDQLTILFQRYADNSCSRAELEDLYRLIQQAGDAKVYELMDERFSNISNGEEADQVDWDAMFRQVVTREKVVPVKRLFWRQIAVAASVLLVISLGSYFLFFNKPAKHGDIVKTVIPKDVEAPKGTKAMITLADGRMITLDSVASGTLAAQGNVQVVKNESGEIVYTGNNREVVYNTLVNPRGSEVVSLTLNDGTKVWLNSESSLKYPIAFAGPERRVEVTGEAYFEVAKDVTKKFVVTGNGVTAEVLGTHFNVNTFADESSIDVTLLEGSVRVSKGSANGLLKPGQQAQVGSDIKVVSNADLEKVMAWKNGLFQFDDANIKSIMKQVERWYDVEAVYEVNTKELTFSGVVGRKENISQLLKVMELTGLVKFEIDGKKIVVKK